MLPSGPGWRHTRARLGPAEARRGPEQLRTCPQCTSPFQRRPPLLRSPPSAPGHASRERGRCPPATPGAHPPLHQAALQLGGGHTCGRGRPGELQGRADPRRALRRLRAPPPRETPPRRLGVSSWSHSQARAAATTSCPPGSHPLPNWTLPRPALPLPEGPVSCSPWGRGRGCQREPRLLWWDWAVVRSGWLTEQGRPDLPAPLAAGASASAAPRECRHVTEGLSAHPQG